MDIRRFLFLVLCTLTLASCGPYAGEYYKFDVTKRVAAPAFMIDRVIQTDSFPLLVYERMHRRNQDAVIYIEGEGDGKSMIPDVIDTVTPENPVALHLAAFDDAKNLAYIARPCQYDERLTAIYADRHQGQDKEQCIEKYWNGAQYSQMVLDAYNQTINEIKARYDIKDIHLVGHGGGGTIAALLAADRNDVLSFKTVGGILDPEAHARAVGSKIPDESLNPVDKVQKLRSIPQHHFIGGQDTYVPPAVLHSYLQALGSSPCVQYSFIHENEHADGWAEKWLELRKIPLGCERDFATENEFVPPVYDEDVSLRPFDDRPLFPNYREIPVKP